MTEAASTAGLYDAHLRVAGGAPASTSIPSELVICSASINEDFPVEG
jgi:hypothetical protein